MSVCQAPGKSLQAVPPLPSTDKGHGAYVLAASNWSWAGTLFLKSSCAA